MKKKINLVILLMTVCAVTMLGIQLYTNYDAYRKNERIFRIGVDAALKRSVAKLMNIRRDEFAEQYKRWLLDTNLISISYETTQAGLKLILEDKKPIDKEPRPPFDILLPAFKSSSSLVTPQLKKELVGYFVTNFLYNDFINGRTLFFTTSLGTRQAQAFQRDKINLTRLKKIYADELRKEDIFAPFKFEVKGYQFTKFNAAERDSLGKDYITHPNLYGFGKKVTVAAVFPNLAKASLGKMKWLIFSSLILMSITIFCFAYTLRTMLSQKKLAMLKDDFVNNMTHELKTPVATIGIAAEAIDDFKVDKSVAKEYLSIIRSQANNMTKLIEQLLGSMLIGQTPIALGFERISFNETVRSTLQLYHPQLLLTEAIVKTDFAQDKFIVNGDQIHLANVIGNLIDNAIKYSKGQPLIKINLYRQNKGLVFEISNTTDEIMPQYLNRLFEKFFRVPKGNLHEVKGYGLGLSYVAQIVQQHNGKIKASIYKDLITFTLTMPLDEYA